MKPATHITLDLFGAKKRIGNLKQIIGAAEKQHRLTHISLVSTPQCITYYYQWGHIQAYTYPNESLVLIDIFSGMCSIKTKALKKTLLSVLAPSHYDEHEQRRMVC